MISRNFAAALLSTAVVATDPHEAMKIAGVVEGFFIGAFDFHGMTDIGHCLGDVNPLEEHLENSMRGFWNGSYQEVTKAIDQMGLSVSDIGDMLDHCGKIDHHDYEQIQRMAEAFLHPKQLLLEATESIIINGVNIFEDVRESLHDYRMGHFLDSGEHFGQAAAMLLYGKTQMVEHEELFFDFDNHWQELLDQIDHEKDDKMHKFEAMKTSNVHFSFFRMGKILEGLLAGSVEAEVPHGVECLRDAKHIWERVGGVVDEFRHATFDSVLHAVEDMGAIINDVAGELEQCKATAGTDLDKLREMSKAFTNPWYFIFHVDHDLIVNGQDVNHELMDAMAQWENQHYYEFGHSLGLALSKIFLGQQMSNGIPMHALPAHGYNPHHNVAEKKEEKKPVAKKDDKAPHHAIVHPVPGHHAPIHDIHTPDHYAHGGVHASPWDHPEHAWDLGHDSHWDGAHHDDGHWGYGDHHDDGHWGYGDHHDAGLYGSEHGWGHDGHYGAGYHGDVHHDAPHSDFGYPHSGHDDAHAWGHYASESEHHLADLDYGYGHHGDFGHYGHTGLGHDDVYFHDGHTGFGHEDYYHHDTHHASPHHF